MVYNILRPDVSASISSVPFKTRGSTMKSSYDNGLIEGEAAAKSRMDEIASLSPKARKLKLRSLTREIKELKHKRDGATKSLAELDREMAGLDRMIIAEEDMLPWAKDILIFQKPSGGAFGSFRQAIAQRNVADLHNWKHPASIDEFEKELLADAAVFVVEHNWMAAIQKADEFVSGSFRLPYEVCAFEFMVTRKRVLVLAVNYSELVEATDVNNEILMQIAIECLNGWALSTCIYRNDGTGWGVTDTDKTTGADPFGRLVQLVGDQIRAACIALDAEVATTETIRAGYEGRKRDTRQLPPYEMHILRLAKRDRPESFSASGEPKKGKRLHFRRGHWRHFTTSKTWVRWCLVGDPELGFIDKQYRL